ncbi:MAG: flagellar motor protein [Betaproteobacteria bacterium]|nr:flagellar motor protein [Betaproteobacteria bacterium]
MDKISIYGILVGFIAILGGQMLEGGHLESLLQPTAFLIVVGGTLGAVMLQSPLPVFISGLKMAKWVFVPPSEAPNEIIGQVIRWSHVARKEGLLALEAHIDSLPDPFARRGLTLLVDGAEPERLREVLEVETGTYEAQLKQRARVWEAAGGYSPTIGILGAVMGLIQVMENLTDPSKLGTGIAVAFVATIYGVGLANLAYLPIFKKLFAIINHLIVLREMYVDGLIGIANGDNPHIIESRMQGYIG